MALTHFWAFLSCVNIGAVFFFCCFWSFTLFGFGKDENIWVTCSCGTTYRVTEQAMGRRGPSESHGHICWGGASNKNNKKLRASSRLTTINRSPQELPGVRLLLQSCVFPSLWVAEANVCSWNKLVYFVVCVATWVLDPFLKKKKSSIGYEEGAHRSSIFVYSTSYIFFNGIKRIL